MSEPVNSNEDKKIQKDLLWGLYQEYRNHARHSETLRSTVNNYVMVVSSALITLATFDKNIDSSDLPLSLLMIFIGFIGVFFSVSYTERYNRHRERASQVRKHLDEMFFPKTDGAVNIKTLRTKADEKNKLMFVRELASGHYFWLVIPLVVFLIGIFLAYLAFKS